MLQCRRKKGSYRWAMNGLIFQKWKPKLSDSKRFSGQRVRGRVRTCLNCVFWLFGFVLFQATPLHVMPPTWTDHPSSFRKVGWSVDGLGGAWRKHGVRETGKKVQGSHILDITWDGGSSDRDKGRNLRKRTWLCTHNPLFLLEDIPGTEIVLKHVLIIMRGDCLPRQ